MTVAWAEAYGQGFVHDAIHWFLHKFNADLVDTLGEFKAAARLMCHCSFPQPNTSVHPFTGRNSCGHSLLGHHIMDGLCRELPAYFARAEGVSFKAEHGRSG